VTISQEYQNPANPHRLNGTDAHILVATREAYGKIRLDRSAPMPRTLACMPEINRKEFDHLPLRVHAFLEGVSLHDVWAVNLPRVRSGITLSEFLRHAPDLLHKPPLAVRTLLAVRFFVGGLFGWDRPQRSGETRPGLAPESFAQRLTDQDRSRSLLPAGTRDGLFRIVYRFDNEQLSELINRTAHAAALSTLAETGASYRFYFAVYVKPVSRFTPLYLAAIEPFRKMIVYPVLLRAVARQWDAAFGNAAG
jgi:hypothetical protein